MCGWGEQDVSGMVFAAVIVTGYQLCPCSVQYCSSSEDQPLQMRTRLIKLKASSRWLAASEHAAPESLVLGLLVVLGAPPLCDGAAVEHDDHEVGVQQQDAVWLDRRHVQQHLRQWWTYHSGSVAHMLTASQM